MDNNTKGNYNSSFPGCGFNSSIPSDIEIARSFPQTETASVNQNHCAQYHNRNFNSSVNAVPQVNNPSTLYPSQQTDLEKLFTHATEVKGDLENVINALVGIIGNEPQNQPNDDITSNPTECLNVDYQKPKFFPTKHSTQANFLGSNKAAPSVNVENVLKIVRANKMNKERHQRRYASSQSSESSREKIAEKVECPMNMYEYNMRSMLSDPGHMERRNQSIDVTPNRRRYKTKHGLNSNASAHLVSTDTCIKRSKSIKAANEMGTEFSQLQLPNPLSENMIDHTESGHQWVKHSPTLGQSDSREFFNFHNQDMILHGSEMMESTYYKCQSRYGWSPSNEASNAMDESSCSSWSLMSQNYRRLHKTNDVARNCSDLNLGPKTPSISVSDSEGSTEPIRPTPIKKIPRLPSLGTQLRCKEGQFEFVLINQPEQHHRARYMTEGSRGAVKDRSGNGFPTVQLIGWKRPATLQIFVGTEDGRVKPHNFYQACKVSGKQILSCKERMFDGTGLIEIQIENKDNQMIVLDCIGILKLRNVDVERRAGIQRVKLKSSMARLVFRVNLPHGDGFFTCLQVTSDPILCTQPVGSPEVCKMSLCQCSCKGNVELFIIGKNIVKCCQVLFQDYSEHKGVIWQSEARIDVEYLHQSHLICTVPPYCNENIRTAVTVQVIINCNGRTSEPRYFTYLPDTPAKPMDLIDSYGIDDWKMLKSDYTDLTAFPIENCHLNSDLSNPNQEQTFIKSTNDIMYNQEYNKPKEPSFTHMLFPPSNDLSNYNEMCSTMKSIDNLPTLNAMEWIPPEISNDISITSISTPTSFDAMSNSLDSNIQNEFIPYFPSSDNTHMTIIQSESMNTLTESNDILTNL